MKLGRDDTRAHRVRVITRISIYGKASTNATRIARDRRHATADDLMAYKAAEQIR